jgi:hypothetical protein
VKPPFSRLETVLVSIVLGLLTAIDYTRQTIDFFRGTRSKTRELEAGEEQVDFAPYSEKSNIKLEDNNAA